MTELSWQIASFLNSISIIIILYLMHQKQKRIKNIEHEINYDWKDFWNDIHVRINDLSSSLRNQERSHNKLLMDNAASHYQSLAKLQAHVAVCQNKLQAFEEHYNLEFQEQKFKFCYVKKENEGVSND